MSKNEERRPHIVPPSAAVADSVLAQLARLAEQQLAAQAKVADLEEQLQQAKQELRDISEQLIPDLMDQAGISEFRTLSGHCISIDEVIRAHIAKERAPLALAWLRDHGHGALIKRTISVSFTTGEDDRAEQLRRSLEGSYDIDDRAAVHPSSLSAFVRDMLSEGEDIPMELFGVYRQRVARIK